MRKLHFFSILVALIFATTTLWATPSGAIDGKISGKFSVQNGSGSPVTQVYFSQGNLQYQASTNTWRFAEEQFHFVGSGAYGNVYVGEEKCDNASMSSTYSGWIDLMACVNIDDPFGAQTPLVWMEDSLPITIKDVDSRWRILTSAEWQYLFNTRSGARASTLTNTATSTTTTDVRYVRATVNGVQGIILFPDGGSFDDTEFTVVASLNTLTSSFESTTCTLEQWRSLEEKGCVFSPMPGNFFNGPYALSPGGYRTYASKNIDGLKMGHFIFTNNTNFYGYINTNALTSFRLVSKIAPKYPSSITDNPEANPSEYTYNGDEHILLSDGGTAVGGTMMYKINDGEWSSELPKATNAGTYTVYYMVKGDATHKDYTPEPNTITVTINKADIDVSGLSVTGNEIVANGNLQELVSVTGSFTGGTLNYSLNGVDWSEDIPTASAVGEYKVYYKIVGDVNHNDYTPSPAFVTAVIDLYPFVADNADPTAKLIDFSDDGSMNLRVKRTIYADDEYNTICLPFALDASALAASPLAGYNRLKAFKGAQVSGSGASTNIDIFVEDATAIEAGVPYLISYPSAHADILNPVFEDITVTTTTPGFVSADGVTFQGMFAQVHINQHNGTKDYLFLGENSQLYWPLTSENGNESVKMRGFRAYFIIDRTVITPAAAPSGTRARFVNAPKQPTAIENTELNTQAQKLLENGQLIILKNGIKYNAQGQVLK